MRRRASLALTAAFGVCGMIALAVPTRAATAECIPAANFTTLARIADGSTSQFANLLGLPDQTPPDDGCYAVLLQGPIDKGSAAALAAAIERNKGWLAQVYLAVWDGDLAEEAALSHLMRDFALTGVFLQSGDFYVPDFLALPQPLPASVSNAWAEAEQQIRQPIALSFRDYLDSTARKIEPAARPCGAGCWSVLSGAIERRFRLALGPVPPDAADGLETPQAKEVRKHLRDEFGVDITLIKATSGYRSRPDIPRFAGFDRGAIEKDCRSALDYANAIGGDIVKGVNSFAVRDFPFARLSTALPKIRRFQDAAGKAELCMRKGLARLRMKTFRERCKETCGEEFRRIEKIAAGGTTTDVSSPPMSPASALKLETQRPR